MTAPRVSILMTVFNGERYLAEAIDSLLAQTFLDFELIVVDDASTDGSAAILARYAGDPRLRLVRNDENIGLTRSLNKALGVARADLIARQDADDRSLPRRLERQVQFMDAHPQFALIGSDARTIGEDGRVRLNCRPYRARTPIGVLWQTLFGNPFIHSSVMVRRAVIAGRFGGYDESFRFNQDFELWSRLVLEYTACNVPEVLVEYRSHDVSITRQRDEVAMEGHRQNLRRNMAVQRRNVATILGDAGLADEWSSLWTAINVGWLTGPPDHPARALPLLECMHRRFVELHPEAAGSRDVAALRASLLWSIARYLAGREPLACVNALLGLARQHFSMTFTARSRMRL